MLSAVSFLAFMRPIVLLETGSLSSADDECHACISKPCILVSSPLFPAFLLEDQANQQLNLKSKIRNRV